MSYVVLQVGQCGNQLGAQFFSILAETSVRKAKSAEENSFAEEVKQRFFTESDAADSRLLSRAVLVDTEPKVIKETTISAHRQGLWQYPNDSSYVQRQGAANNWAFGYLRHGAAARESVLDLIRKESERCDYLIGFLPFMSVAGGTGSGLGTFLTEALKDEFPSTPVMNHVVWPFSKGEVTVQAYNATLSLAHLQSSSDAIIIFENDQLHKVCTQRMGIRDVSLDHLNSVASQQLACLLLPSSSPCGITPLFGDILAHLVPHPQFKLLGLRSVPQEPLSALPFSFYTWPGLLRTLRRMVLFSTVVDEISSRSEEILGQRQETPLSLSNLLVLRGPDADVADPALLHKPSLPYVSWVPPVLRLKTWTHPLPLFGHDRMAALASNGQFITHCVDEAVAKAWKMFNYKAYLHHYRRYGLSDDDFVDSFARVEQIIASYKSLTTG